jgi:hypothetical protein
MIDQKINDSYVTQTSFALTDVRRSTEGCTASGAD